ncbi:hypothetical protein [Lutimonas vermicola]|uniref:Cytochrome c domain-containing protein n=1 Tax=Lutimonas vermicola TaxID=414288 RepID=A0ABU9KY50_9FLAO
MKNTVKILILMAMGLFLGSCYNDTFPEEEEGPAPTDVSYSEKIQPLWNTDCTSCHPSIAQPDLSSNNSYNSLINGGFVIPGNADDSVLYQSLLGSNGVSLMPTSGQWPISQIKLVESWINEGAKDN